MTQLVDLVSPGFVIKYYQAKILILLIKLELGNSDVPDYIRKFNDYHSFGNLKFPKILLFVYYGSLRADLMLAYSLNTFKSISELQLHDVRRNLCRLPTTSRVDSQRQLQLTSSKTSGYSKGNWNKQSKHSEDGSPQHFDKPNRPSVGAFGSEGHGHGNSSLGQKRKLPPREQNKKDSWIKA